MDVIPGRLEEILRRQLNSETTGVSPFSSFIDRPEGEDEDFFEEDEPVGDLLAEFDRAPDKGKTQ